MRYPAGNKTYSKVLDVLFMPVMLVQNKMEAFAILYAGMVSREMVLCAGKSVMATLRILVLIAWSLNLTEEEQDTHYGIAIGVIDEMIMDVRNMELSGTLNAKTAITMKDAVFALLIVLMAWLILEYHAKRKATEEEQVHILNMKIKALKLKVQSAGLNVQLIWLVVKLLAS